MAIKPINIVVKNRIEGTVATSLRDIATNAIHADTMIKNLQASLAGIDPTKIKALNAAQVTAARTAATLAAEESKVAIAADRAAISKNKLTISGNQVTISEQRTADAMANSEIKAVKLTGAEEMLDNQRQRRARTNRVVMTNEELAAEATLKRARAMNVVTRQQDAVRVSALNVAQAVKATKEGSVQHKHALDQQKLSLEALNASQVRYKRIVNETAAAIDNYEHEVRSTTGAVNGLSAANDRASVTNNLHNTTMLRSGANMGLSAHHAQNLAFQVQDIGVSLASGQPAWRVFMQQGAQIQGIMGQARIGVMGLASAIWAMTAPFLPFVAAVAAAGGAVALFAGHLGEIDHEAVTMSETIGAMASVLIDDLTPAWEMVSSAASSVGEGFMAVLPAIVGGLDVLFNSLKFLGQATGTIFGNLGTVVAEGLYTVVNGAIGAVESLINAVIGGLNAVGNSLSGFFAPMRGLLDHAGIEVGEFTDLTEVSLGRVENAYAGATTQTLEMLQAQLATTMAGTAFADTLQATIEYFETYSERVGEAVIQNRKLADAEEEAEAAIERQAALLTEIQAPVQDYINRMGDLESLLKRNRITQEQYNDALRDIPLNQALAALDTSLLDDFGQEMQAIEDQFTQREKLLSKLREAGAISEQAYQDRLQAIREDAREQSIALQAAHIGEESALFDMRRDVYEQGFSDILSIMGGAVGEQSGVYRTLFAIQKAFAIAESVIAIQQAVSKAMALGFPQNIPFIAAAVSQGASIVSTIQSTSPKFASGGMVSGPGGGTDDKINAWLSNGEFVVNAKATSQHLPLLRAINDNGPVPATAFAQGGLVSDRAVDRSTRSVSNTGGATSNVFDFRNANFGGMQPGEIADAIERRIDNKIRTEVAPRILTQARETSNEDMQQRFGTEGLG